MDYEIEDFELELDGMKDAILNFSVEVSYTETKDTLDYSYGGGESFTVRDITNIEIDDCVTVTSDDAELYGSKIRITKLQKSYISDAIFADKELMEYIQDAVNELEE